MSITLIPVSQHGDTVEATAKYLGAPAGVYDAIRAILGMVKIGPCNLWRLTSSMPDVDERMLPTTPFATLESIATREDAQGNRQPYRANWSVTFHEAGWLFQSFEYKFGVPCGDLHGRSKMVGVVRDVIAGYTDWEVVTADTLMQTTWGDAQVEAIGIPDEARKLLDTHPLDKQAQPSSAVPAALIRLLDAYGCITHPDDYASSNVLRTNFEVAAGKANPDYGVDGDTCLWDWKYIDGFSRFSDALAAYETCASYPHRELIMCIGGERHIMDPREVERI